MLSIPKTRKPLEGGNDSNRCAAGFINAISEGRWEDFILSEWELDACGWEDFHPHTETNFVLEGVLHIESEGKTVILKPGDSARVNPGQLGRYRAPVYARMVTVYGPNPEGLESNSFRHFELCADFLDGLKARDNGFSGRCHAARTK